MSSPARSSAAWPPGGTPKGHCCIWRSGASTSSTQIPERHEWPSRSTALRSSHGPPHGKRLHSETRRSCPSSRCNSAPELGAMAARGMPYLLGHPWIPLAPAVAVFLHAFAANLAGDGLRDLLEDT